MLDHVYLFLPVPLGLYIQLPSGSAVGLWLKNLPQEEYTAYKKLKTKKKVVKKELAGKAFFESGEQTIQYVIKS